MSYSCDCTVIYSHGDFSLSERCIVTINFAFGFPAAWRSSEFFAGLINHLALGFMVVTSLIVFLWVFFFYINLVPLLRSSLFCLFIQQSVQSILGLWRILIHAHTHTYIYIYTSLSLGLHPFDIPKHSYFVLPPTIYPLDSRPWNNI